MFNMHVLAYYSHRFWTAKTFEEYEYYRFIRHSAEVPCAG